ETSAVAPSMRRARCGYGSAPSEKATFRAPIALTSPLPTDPSAAPTASGNAIPNAFRRATPGIALSFWNRRMACQKATVHATLGQNAFHYGSGDSGEPRVEALELHAEALMIDAEQVQHRGVKIVNADRILLRRVAQLVGRPVGDSAFDSSAGQHVREALDVV